MLRDGPECQDPLPKLKADSILPWEIVSFDPNFLPRYENL